MFGVWTDEAGRNQIEFTTFGEGSDVIYYTFRNSNYEDEVYMVSDFRWMYNKGCIEWDDGENVIMVERGGQAITINDIRLTKGGSLVARPIPKDALWDAAMTTSLPVSIWSIPFERLYNRVIRNANAEYISYEEYDDAALHDEHDDMVGGLNGQVYVVRFSGEVSKNPELDFLYYEAETIATFVIVMDGSRVTYAVCDSACQHLITAATIYAASLM